MYNKRGLTTGKIISIAMLALISSVAILQLMGTIDIVSWTLNPIFGQTNSNKVNDVFILKTEGKEGVPYPDDEGVSFGDEDDAPESYYLDLDSGTGGLPPGITLSSNGGL